MTAGVAKLLSTAASLTIRISGGCIVILLMTAISRAIPRTLKQSPRLGVIEISSIWLSKPRYSRMSIPIGASADSSSRPSTSSTKSISEAPQSIPLEAMPRSSLALISKPALPLSVSAVGNTAPIVATGAFIPTATFGAPQTI